MKRTVYLLLALCALLSFSACGAQPETAEPAEADVELAPAAETPFTYEPGTGFVLDVGSSMEKHPYRLQYFERIDTESGKIFELGTQYIKNVDEKSGKIYPDCQTFWYGLNGAPACCYVVFEEEGGVHYDLNVNYNGSESTYPLVVHYSTLSMKANADGLWKSDTEEFLELTDSDVLVHSRPYAEYTEPWEAIWGKEMDNTTQDEFRFGDAQFNVVALPDGLYRSEVILDDYAGGYESYSSFFYRIENGNIIYLQALEDGTFNELGSVSKDSFDINRASFIAHHYDDYTPLIELGYDESGLLYLNSDGYELEEEYCKAEVLSASADALALQMTYDDFTYVVTVQGDEVVSVEKASEYYDYFADGWQWYEEDNNDVYLIRDNHLTETFDRDGVLLYSHHTGSDTEKANGISLPFEYVKEYSYYPNGNLERQFLDLHYTDGAWEKETTSYDETGSNEKISYEGIWRFKDESDGTYIWKKVYRESDTTKLYWDNGLPLIVDVDNDIMAVTGRDQMIKYFLGTSKTYIAPDDVVNESSKCFVSDNPDYGGEYNETLYTFEDNTWTTFSTTFNASLLDNYREKKDNAYYEEKFASLESAKEYCTDHVLSEIKVEFCVIDGETASWDSLDSTFTGKSLMCADYLESIGYYSRAGFDYYVIAAFGDSSFGLSEDEINECYIKSAAALEKAIAAYSDDSPDHVEKREEAANILEDSKKAIK